MLVNLLSFLPAGCAAPGSCLAFDASVWCFIVVAVSWLAFADSAVYPQVDIEDEDDAERALTLSNPVLESLER